jgi:hypothetical protein
MQNKGLLLLFTLMLVLTDSVISRIKNLSHAVGRWMSRTLYGKGLVDCDPLSGPIQMKKWTEQSWQLVVHIVFSIIEGYILYQEPWYDRPATCWIPHPYEQAKSIRTDLLLLYMAQMVSELARLVHRSVCPTFAVYALPYYTCCCSMFLSHFAAC